MRLARRRIAVELLPELNKPDVHEEGLLTKAMYSTRDAAMCWEAESASLLVASMGFVQGRGSQLLQQRQTVASQCAR